MERWPEPSGTVRGRAEGVAATEARSDQTGDPGEGAEPGEGRACPVGTGSQVPPPSAVLQPQGSIVVRTGTALLRLNVAEIVLIEADEPSSRVWAAGDTPHGVTMAMKAWMELLPPEIFCRLDRSYIVNLNKVSGLRAETRSENQVSFVGWQRTINVGRAGATRLKQLLLSRDEALRASDQRHRRV